MLHSTGHTVDKRILPICAEYAQDGKLVVNTPTGNFFYDPWELLPEFKNTAIETALNALPFAIGEARLVSLEPGKCYFAHADIDDRYHLNLSGTYSTLVDLTNKETFWIEPDGIWYEMDAGRLHTAVNAGEYTRVQLLVRKLLPLTTLKEPVSVYVRVTGENARYRFDNTLSPWLNRAVKQGIVSNFEVNGASVYFNVEKAYVDSCVKIIPEQFNYEY